MRVPYLFRAMRKEVLLLMKLSQVECPSVVHMLTIAEIQRFSDWINNQEVTTDKPVDEPPQTQTPESTDGTVSFQQDLLPILTGAVCI